MHGHCHSHEGKWGHEEKWAAGRRRGRFGGFGGRHGGFGSRFGEGGEDSHAGPAHAGAG